MASICMIPIAFLGGRTLCFGGKVVLGIMGFFAILGRIDSSYIHMWTRRDLNAARNEAVGVYIIIGSSFS